MIIDCRVKKINKFGVMGDAEPIPMKVIVPRQLQNLTSNIQQISSLSASSSSVPVPVSPVSASGSTPTPSLTPNPMQEQPLEIFRNINGDMISVKILNHTIEDGRLIVVGIITGIKQSKSWIIRAETRDLTKQMELVFSNRRTRCLNWVII